MMGSQYKTGGEVFDTRDPLCNMMDYPLRGEEKMTRPT